MNFRIFTCILHHLRVYYTNPQLDQLSVGLIGQLVEHCTGITEVMSSNPVQACILFSFNFTTAQVVYITAIINHVFIMFSLFGLSLPTADTLLSVHCFKNVKECQKC